LFLLPHLVFFVLFVAVPLVFGMVISFFNWSLLNDNVFVGASNYIRTWNDSRFWPVVQNTVIFAIVSVPLTIIVAILFAHILNKKRFGQLWLLIAFVSPAFFGSVGILSSWKWIFASFPSGLANYYLNKAGFINAAVSWFGSTGVAWGVIILVTIWWIVGFSILLYMGALQRIPPEQYESAKLDGAGPWKRFLYITLPWIRSVLFFDVVRQVILAFGLFDQAYILSAGACRYHENDGLLPVPGGVRETGFRKGCVDIMVYFRDSAYLCDNTARARDEVDTLDRGVRG
jgi:multiple sugar transport system permease protein